MLEAVECSFNMLDGFKKLSMGEFMEWAMECLGLTFWESYHKYWEIQDLVYNPNNSLSITCEVQFED